MFAIRTIEGEQTYHETHTPLLSAFAFVAMALSTNRSSVAFGQQVFDNGYVKFTVLPGWTATQSADQHRVHLDGPYSSTIEILISKDLPRSLGLLGPKIRSLAKEVAKENFPKGQLRDEGACQLAAGKIARWNSVDCDSTMLDSDNHRLLVSSQGTNLGGSGYVFVSLAPAYDKSVSAASTQAEELDRTIHFWTETVERNPAGPEPFSGSAARSSQGSEWPRATDDAAAVSTPSEQTEPSLVGLWKSYPITQTTMNNLTLPKRTFTANVTFKADGSYVLIVDQSEAPAWQLTARGTYTVSNNSDNRDGRYGYPSILGLNTTSVSFKGSQGSRMPELEAQRLAYEGFPGKVSQTFKLRTSDSSKIEIKGQSNLTLTRE